MGAGLYIELIATNATAGAGSIQTQIKISIDVLPVIARGLPRLKIGPGIGITPGP
jgi:hypothetical protein